MALDTHETKVAKVHGAELLSVRIGEQEFAIDIMSVREIRGWIASTPLPHAPSYIRGMINLRGVIMAIVDLAERLGLPSREPNASSVVVVVEVQDRIIGLLIDAVCDIITVTEDMIQAPPKIGGEVAKGAVQGLITVDGRITSILSIPAILPDDLPEAMQTAA